MGSHSKKRNKKRKRSSSSSSSSSSFSSSSTSSSDSSSSTSSSSTSSKEERRKKRKTEKIQRKTQKLKKTKLEKTKFNLNKKLKIKEINDKVKTISKSLNEPSSCDIPLNLMEKGKSMAPMTKEEWEKKQNTIRKEYDESTGRYRLIKGDGEVIEEIVSKERHKEINKLATKGDGEYFQSKLNKSSR